MFLTGVQMSFLFFHRHHLNEVGTYNTNLISGLINIKHSVLTQQVKLVQHMALFLFSSEAKVSAGPIITPPPVVDVL